MKRSRQSGFTLLEIVIVCVIMAVLLGIIISVFASSRGSQSVEKDARLVVSILDQAREQTLSSQNETQYGVHLASSTITLFTGSSYSGSDPNNQLYYLNAGDSINSVSLLGGGSDVIFNRLTGETGESGSLIVSSTIASSTKSVTIYETGLVESN